MTVVAPSFGKHALPACRAPAELFLVFPAQRPLGAEPVSSFRRLGAAKALSDPLDDCASACFATGAFKVPYTAAVKAGECFCSQEM